MPEAYEINLNWQATVVIVALLCVPGAAGLWIDLLLNPEGDTYWIKTFCASVILVGSLLCLLAIRSRLVRTPDAKGRRAIWKRLAVGLLMIVIAVAATALSATCFSWSYDESRWFILPSGLYVVGLVSISKAMLTQKATADRRGAE